MNGHEVSGEAYDGKECIEKLNGTDEFPDLILMDHRMPIKGGLETLKDLLEMNPELKIIFISADLSVKQNALSEGAVSFLKKPFNLQLFLDTISRF